MVTPEVFLLETDAKKGMERHMSPVTRGWEYGKDSGPQLSIKCLPVVPPDPLPALFHPALGPSRLTCVDHINRILGPLVSLFVWPV